jgi:hypothetical protein
MAPIRRCPVMSGQFIVPAPRSAITRELLDPTVPIIFYQQCIQDECEMWDRLRETCGLKQEAH